MFWHSLQCYLYQSHGYSLNMGMYSDVGVGYDNDIGSGKGRLGDIFISANGWIMSGP